MSASGSFVCGSRMTSPILWQKSQVIPSAASPVRCSGLTPGSMVLRVARSEVRLVWQPDQPQFFSLEILAANGVWQVAQFPLRSGLSSL